MFMGVLHEYVKERWKKLKKWAVEYKGGKCEVCGYNKCIAALEFHHRDPKEKEAAWTSIRKRSFEFIKKELDKCALLCACCHREVHFNKESFEDSVKRIKEKERTSLTEEACKTCGCSFKKKSSSQIYCCVKCVPKKLLKYGNDSEFIQLVELTSLSNVAREFGVSQRYIAKRYRKLKRLGQDSNLR